MGNFLRKISQCKSLRLKQHTHLKMEAVSTSTESHNGVMLPKIPRWKQSRDTWYAGIKGCQEKFKVYLHWKVLVPQRDQVFSLRRYWR
jgi:hypothetical protein